MVTPEGAALEEKADFVALPMYDGELGVLPGRAPLIGRLGYGELRIRQGDKVQRFYVDGGFVQVRDNVVSVLTDKATRPEEIDLQGDRAGAGASQLLAATVEEQEARLKAAERARAQLRVAQYRNADRGASRLSDTSPGSTACWLCPPPTTGERGGSPPLP